MSQEYYKGEGKSRRSSSTDKPANSPSRIRSPPPGPFQRPSYMTVGSGSTSASAAALMASLENDSGYGSFANGESEPNFPRFNPSLAADRPTPSHTPTHPGEYNEAADHERRVLAAHVHQLQFNQNRASLSRAIIKTIELLKNLQEENKTWPAHYPAVQNMPGYQQNASERRPSMQQSHSTMGDYSESSFRPSAPKRAATSLEETFGEESSTVAEKRPAPEPRLFTPQIQNDFSILKLNLNMGSLPQADLVHSLDKQSIASLLDGKIRDSIRHLLLLRDRIEDTSSKVLVTGDLNAGKSTFCNALLRRKVLPEDQQPCTSIFCEVLHARENGNMEEVHAIHKGAVYNRNDESTYDVYKLEELENIVIDNAKYIQCKVYVKDERNLDESLLNNGVMDISIIDAPGLNSDSLKTTAVFTRQEEIDVVVFVVSAANHFTLSAKEFIWNAAHEKAYIFMVVNGFDNIRDKKRCERMILEQVANLSPRTFKESSELVHFVSSNAIPVAPPMPGNGPGGDGPGGSGSGGFSGPSGEPDDEDKSKSKGKGKAAAIKKQNMADFAHLEASLRRFVLEKRSRSKLFPAKTYLLNVLNDLLRLASVNRDVAQAEFKRVSTELETVEPQFNAAQRASKEVTDKVYRNNDDAYSNVFEHTLTTLDTTIRHIGDADLDVPYPGLWSAFQYADDLRVAMLDHITSAVESCEDYARGRSTQGVNAIKCLGLRNVGEKFPDLTFRSDLMFRKRRDTLARQIDTQVDVWDFFDFSSIWAQQEKLAGTSMAVTVAGIVGGRLIGGVNLVDSTLSVVKVVGVKNLKYMVVPGLIASVVLAGTYVLHLLPQTLPHTISRKLQASLLTPSPFPNAHKMTYPQQNATRIASEVRKVLHVPSTQLSAQLQTQAKDLGEKKEGLGKRKEECHDAQKWFDRCVREVEGNKRGVEGVELDTVG
ncbi:MAG: mitofusin [Cirrosporium novae-zelandiae]|nr:MAG: mitofusin [Cirrosporium novae-zelandiae]